MKTLAKCISGFVVGWLIYMVAMVLTVYDGLLSLILQPFMAALFSSLFVGLAFVAGLPLRARIMRDVWSRIGLWVLTISVAAIVVMIFSAKLGLESEVMDPDAKELVKVMDPLTIAICYFLALFPIVNLPAKQSPNSIVCA